MRMNFTEYQLRRQIVAVARTLAEQGLARSSDGNISVRLDDQRLLITPSGAHKGSLRPKDILVIDLQGNPLSRTAKARPSSETWMHVEVYRQRPQVRAVLHAHPPYATALTLAGLSFPHELVPEALVALGVVPTVPYATPGTPQMAEHLQPFLKDYDVLMLDHHGSLTLGQTLEEALIKLERLETVAQLYFLARQLGEIVPLPEGEISRLNEIGIRYRKEGAVK